MKKVCTLLLIATLFGCNVKPKELTQEQVIALISDATYGVDYACYSQWLEGPACTVVYHTLFDATALVSGLKSGWQASAKAVLQREESALPADSKIRPYLDAVISVL